LTSLSRFNKISGEVETQNNLLMVEEEDDSSSNLSLSLKKNPKKGSDNNETKNDKPESG
jgi:hypothetical protein